MIFLSDAGMPGISDPGAAIASFALKNGIKFDVLPGANATILAFCMSASGLFANNFTDFARGNFIFGGFLPPKQLDRKRALNDHFRASEILKSPVIFYESAHRLMAAIDDICEDLGDFCEIFLAKEMTKIHQKFFFGAPKKVREELRCEKILGEWVMVLQFFRPDPKNAVISLKELENFALPPKIFAKIASKITKIPSKKIYEEKIHEKSD